jgi:hypothetical protein
MNMLSQKKKQKKQKSGTFEQHYIIGAYEKMMKLLPIVRMEVLYLSHLV